MESRIQRGSKYQFHMNTGPLLAQLLNGNFGLSLSQTILVKSDHSRIRIAWCWGWATLLFRVGGISCIRSYYVVFLTLL